MYKIIGGDQKEYGPISAEQLRQWFKEGRINGQTSILPDGAAQWSPLAALPEFADLFGATISTTIIPGLAGSFAPPSPEEILARDFTIDIGDCISRAWNLVKNNFWPVVGISLLIYLLIGVINQIPGIVTRPIINGMVTSQRFSPGGFLVIAGISILFTPVYTILTAGLFKYFLKLIRGEDASIGDAFSGFQYFGQLALLGLVMSVLVWIGFLFCLLPGIYLSVAWYFAIPLIVDRGMGFWEAMELSRKVVNKHWFIVFAFLLVTGLVMVCGVFACCVGFFVTAPIGWVALMYAYEDIFGRRAS